MELLRHMPEEVKRSTNFFFSTIDEDGTISTDWCWCYPDDGRQLMWHSRYAPDFAEDAGCEFDLMFNGESPIDDGWDCECIRQRDFSEHEPLTFYDCRRRVRYLDGIDKKPNLLIAYSCWDDDGAIIDSATDEHPGVPYVIQDIIHDFLSCVIL